MKPALAIALATLVLFAGTASAQTSPGGTAPFSISAEALMLWFKGNATAPLVGDGAIDDAGTRVFLGGKDFDTDPNPGFRLTAAYALTPAFGVEASFFYVPERSTSESTGSSGQPGSTDLSVPFFNVLSQSESSTLISSAGNYAGFATAKLSNSLLGGDVNATFRLPDLGPLRLHVLGGFRYLRLREDFTFDTNSPNIPPRIPDIWTTTDRFEATNNFYGGQLGVRARGDWGRWFVSGVFKFAVGVMDQTVDAHGQLFTNDFDNFGAPQTFQGGYLALSTNSGRHNRQVFAVIPELGLNVGYQITPSISVFAGYTFLYANDVVRAPQQINRNINPTGRSAITGEEPGPLTGPAEPAFRFKSSDFWAQGLNVGVGFRF